MASSFQTISHDADPNAVREEFKRRRGHWNDDWEAMLSQSPAYVAAYLDFSAYVADRGTLSAKFRELIYVATNCTPTHMFEKGLRNHARQALALGATPAELFAVVATVSAMGIHSYNLTALAIAELTQGDTLPNDPQHANRIMAKQTDLFGEVTADAEAGIALDPAFYAVWQAFAEVPASRADAALSVKEGHLIALAVHAQCTQLNPAGVRNHARAAIAHGATVEEVLDVGRLISSMGIHAMVFALPVITDLVAKEG